jgi:hypothetical protein
MELLRMSRDNPVGVVAGYGPESLFSIPDKGKRFSYPRNFQADSAAYPASYPVSVEGSCPEA